MARRRRGSSAADAALGQGCLLVAVVGLGIGALVLVLGLLAALFLTPVPYVLMVVAGAGYLVFLFRQQRLQKTYFDAVAALEGVAGAPAGSVEKLWQTRTDEPDIQLLRAVVLAQSNRSQEAFGYSRTVGAKLPRVGVLSGGAALCLPGLSEPIWLGGTLATNVNYQLLWGQLLALSGRYADAAQTLAARLHDPHYAAVLGALVETYARMDRKDRAAAVLQQSLQHVVNPEQQRELRYRLAVYLEELGSAQAALAEYRRLLAHGNYRDAAARLDNIQRAAASAHAQQSLARDEAAFEEALERIRFASGPKTRERALEAGLSRVQQPHMRERLLIEASRLEVDAVLERVAGLKTLKAKQRNLLAALDKLMEDDVPDELQEAEISMLKQALGQLEIR